MTLRVDGDVAVFRRRHGVGYHACFKSVLRPFMLSRLRVPPDEAAFKEARRGAP